MLARESEPGTGNDGAGVKVILDIWCVGVKNEFGSECIHSLGVATFLVTCAAMSSLPFRHFRTSLTVNIVFSHALD